MNRDKEWAYVCIGMFIAAIPIGLLMFGYLQGWFNRKKGE